MPASYPLLNPVPGNQIVYADSEVATTEDDPLDQIRPDFQPMLTP